MFDLEPSDKNLMIITDSRSGSDIGIYYRTPTPKEEVSYQSKVFQRKGKKLIIDANAKVAAAKDIITGVREGDLGFAGQPISTDPAQPTYRADWKDMLLKTGRHILTAFATEVFENTRAEQSTTEIEIQVGEEIPPLPTNSGE